MANTILLKRAATEGKVPLVANVSLGELTINTWDGRLYSKKDTGSPVIVDLTQNDPITLGGDASGTSTNPSAGSGWSNLSVTLNTVNSTTGAFGGGAYGVATLPTFTVNGKGLITAAGNIDLNTLAVTNVSSSGAGNVTVTGTVGNITLELPATGPGAGTTGSATAIPVITVDAYGRVTAITTAAISSTINLAGNTGSGSIATGGTLTVRGGYGVSTVFTDGSDTFDIINTGVVSIAGTSNQIDVSSANAAVTLSLPTDLIVPRDLTVPGNLIIQGNTTTIGTTDLTVNDSIITLHTYANAQPLTGDDGRDIGIKFNYYKTDANIAFLGWANDSGFLEYYASGSESAGNTFTGAKYGTIKSGEFVVANTTVSSDSTSGALRVAGGVGIAGDLNVGGSINAASASFASINNTPIGNATPSTGAFTTLTASGTTTFNTPTAGSLQALAIGNVTPGTGNFTTVTVTNFATGNAQVTGGVLSGLTSVNATTGTIANFASSNVQITGGDLTGITGAATTFVATNFSSGNAVITGGSLNATPIGATTASTANVTTLTTTGTITASGNIVAASGTDSTSTTTGALVVVGGAGVSGNVYAAALYDNGNRAITVASSFGNVAGDVSVSGQYNTLEFTLSTVNATTGSFGNVTHAPTFTVNGKGLITSAGTALITPNWSSITNTPTTIAGYGITDGLTTSSIVDGGTY